MNLQINVNFSEHESYFMFCNQKSIKLGKLCKHFVRFQVTSKQTNRSNSIRLPETSAMFSM